MIKGTINFDDKKVNKKVFYKNTKLYDIYEIDTKKILLNILLDIIPLCVKFPQMVGLC